MNHIFSRAIHLPKRPTTSFFLWGPRQTGKSTLLRALYPDAFWIDLLQTDVFFRYEERPHLLREDTAALTRGSLVVIDEIQKTPPLLDEVHWLIENRRLVFALSGSSARRVRRTPANLLGGRAKRFELSGLVSHEIEPGFDLVRMLNHGYLPSHYLSETAEPLLQGYVYDYLKEEILFEGLVRRLTNRWLSVWRKARLLQN
jgi:predicted AAA+ superfamily ATPase